MLNSKGLNIELFAGGGGVSSGAGMAGVYFDIAINHNPVALAIHKANFPHSRQMVNDVFEYHPLLITKGKHVHSVHASPDCTYHSRAKGSALGRHTVCGDDCATDHTKLTVSDVDRTRGLAWVLLAYALTARPDRLTLENVVEFMQWGPTTVDDKGNIVPDAERKGQTFDAFRGVLGEGIPRDHPALEEIRSFLVPLLGDDYREDKLLRGLGYELDFRELTASDYGAPTSRKRLFMIARCDGIPVSFPAKTHGDPESDKVKTGKLLPWRTAGECIDWEMPAPSIFGTKAEIKEKYNLQAVRPLADNTMKRIAKGVKKFVLDTKTPYIVENGSVSANYIMNAKGTCSKRMPIGNSPTEPLTTITTSDSHGVVSSTLKKERVTAANILKWYGMERDGQDINKPLHTITTKERFALIEEELKMEPLSEEERYSAWWIARMLEDFGDVPCPRIGSIPLPRPRQLKLESGYVIIDIGIRMLSAKELFMAQGFPTDFVYDPEIAVMSRGKMKIRKVTKTEAVRMVGNSVPPHFARAIYGELDFMDGEQLETA